MAEGGPHWHPNDIAQLTYAQMLLFCQDRSKLVQQLKNRRKHGGDKRVRTIEAGHGIPTALRGKVKTAPGGMSLAKYIASEQAKEKTNAKRSGRKRRKGKG